MAVLAVANLAKSYGDLKAVDGVSFEVEAGEIYGLLGPNGAGKTTTISIVSTLLGADGGSVLINGGQHAGDVRRRIGLVPQEISLAEKLTGIECLRFYGRLYDLRGRDLADRVQRRLADVGLSDRANDRVSTYSGGMQRRLNIAAALLHDPALLLMDEPTAGVDPQSRAYIFEVVETLAGKGVAVVYTTHYMEEAERLCRRIGIMDHGRILAEGTLAELTDRVDTGRSLAVVAADLDEQRAGKVAGDLGVASYELTGDGARFTVPRGEGVLLAAMRSADRHDIDIRSAELHEPNLESVFLKLTGRALRD